MSGIKYGFQTWIFSELFFFCFNPDVRQRRIFSGDLPAMLQCGICVMFNYM